MMCGSVKSWYGMGTCDTLYRVRKNTKEMIMDAGMANCISSVTSDPLLM
jgi:hypothetical protein